MHRITLNTTYTINDTIVFILHSYSMFTQQEIIWSLTQEHNIIKHLAHKITTDEQLQYRPTESQRTLEELLQYISRMTLTMGTMIQDKKSSPEKNKEFKLKSEAMNALTDFDAAMDAQLIFATDFINWLAEEDLAMEFDLFGMGHSMPLSNYLLNILLKNYPAYRMQLFHYLKSGLGMTELNTMNLWMGMDKPMN